MAGLVGCLVWKLGQVTVVVHKAGQVIPLVLTKLTEAATRDVLWKKVFLKIS